MANGWEQALRRLSRRPPQEDIQQAILNVMRGDEPDRVVAIVSASYVEISLAMGIARVLNPNQKGIMDLFWRNDGPFATFERRIIGVSALRLVGNVTAKNLGVIRNIRNIFAHSISNIEFSTPEISRACFRLTFSDNAKFFIEKEEKRKERFAYCYVCNTIFQAFLNDFGTSWLIGRLGTSRESPVLP